MIALVVFSSVTEIELTKNGSCTEFLISSIRVHQPTHNAIKETWNMDNGKEVSKLKIREVLCCACNIT